MGRLESIFDGGASAVFGYMSYLITSRSRDLERTLFQYKLEQTEALTSYKFEAVRDTVSLILNETTMYSWDLFMGLGFAVASGAMAAAAIHEAVDHEKNVEALGKITDKLSTLDESLCEIHERMEEVKSSIYETIPQDKETK